MAEKIIFKGKSYDSVAEMPPDVRALYERMSKLFTDADRDGVPDIFQQGGMEGVRSAFGTIKDIFQMAQSGDLEDQAQLSIIEIGNNNITVNGKTFRSPNEMPGDVRRMYEKAVRTAEPGEYDIYEEPWRKRDRDSYFSPHDDELIEPAYTNPSSSSVMEPVGANSMLIIAVVLAALVCGAVGVILWLTDTGLL